MESIDDDRRQQAARDAVQRLHLALGTLRQHPHHASLCRAATRRCVDAVLAATAQAPVRLRLGDGEASLDGEPMFTFQPHEAPFAALRAAGIGEVVLPRDLTAAAIERLVTTLANVQWSDDPDRDAAARLCAAVPEVHLRAAVAEDAPNTEPPRADWWLLPGPGGDGAPMQATIERALHSNLPARCARQLLADLDEHGPGPVEVLEPLFAALLQRGDLATAAWLLEQAGLRPEVPTAAFAAMQQVAAAHCDDSRLRQLLTTAPREQQLDLLTLAMQLGDIDTERLRRVADELCHPMAEWLDDLIGRR